MAWSFSFEQEGAVRTRPARGKGAPAFDKIRRSFKGDFRRFPPPEPISAQVRADGVVPLSWIIEGFRERLTEFRLEFARSMPLLRIDPNIHVNFYFWVGNPQEPLPMTSHTVRISRLTHKKLKELAQQAGVSISAVVECAVEEYDKRVFLEACNASFAALRADTKAWADELAERAIWDQSLMDDLDHD